MKRLYDGPPIPGWKLLNNLPTGFISPGQITVSTLDEFTSAAGTIFSGTAAGERIELNSTDKKLYYYDITPDLMVQIGDGLGPSDNKSGIEIGKTDVANCTLYMVSTGSKIALVEPGYFEIDNGAANCLAHINVGNATSEGSLNFGDTGADSRGRIVYNHTNFDLKLYTEGVERLALNNAGTITFNQAYTFPAADGTADYVLKTNGSGVLAWIEKNDHAHNASDIPDFDGLTVAAGDQGKYIRVNIGTNVLEWVTTSGVLSDIGATSTATFNDHDARHLSAGADPIAIDGMALGGAGAHANLYAVGDGAGTNFTWLTAAQVLTDIGGAPVAHVGSAATAGHTGLGTAAAAATGDFAPIAHVNSATGHPDATTAAHGFMTDTQFDQLAANVSKLSGIEALADVTGSNPPQAHTLDSHTGVLAIVNIAPGGPNTTLQTDGLGAVVWA